MRKNWEQSSDGATVVVKLDVDERRWKEMREGGGSRCVRITRLGRSGSWKLPLIPELYTSHNRGYSKACYVTLYDTLLVPLEREIFFTSIFPT